jgi:hypothetical protein
MRRASSSAPSLFDEPVVDMSRPAVGEAPAFDPASAFGRHELGNARRAGSTFLPITGSTPGARHASASGAAAASLTRPDVKSAYWRLFVDAKGQPVAVSDHEAVEMLKDAKHRGSAPLIFTSLSSINSTRNSYNRGEDRRPLLDPVIVDSGTFEDHEFENGTKTKRTRWIRRELLDQFLERLEREQKLTTEIRAHIHHIRNERPAGMAGAAR